VDHAVFVDCFVLVVAGRLCDDSAFEVLRGLCDEESRQEEEMLCRR